MSNGETIHPLPVEQGMATGAVCEVISDGEENLGPNSIAVIQVKDLEVLGLGKNRSTGEKRIVGDCMD